MLPDYSPRAGQSGNETNSCCPSQDMKRSFVCASSCIKHVQPFIWLLWDVHSCLYVCLYCAKKIFHT